MNQIIETPFILKYNSHHLIGITHKPSNNTKKPPIIVCHGFTGTKIESDRLFVSFARRASRQGYPVLRFDFTGSGDSSGEFEDTTLSQWLNDLDRIISETPNLLSSPNHPILAGISLGGSASIIQAASDKRIQAVICWAPGVFLVKSFRKLFGEALWERLNNEQIAYNLHNTAFALKPTFLEDIKQYKPINSVKNISPRPLLIIHGSWDNVVPIDYARQLYEAADNPKKLIEIPHADHSFTYYQERLITDTLTWIDTL